MLHNQLYRMVFYHAWGVVFSPGGAKKRPPTELNMNSKQPFSFY
jgi:hypothetical protein